MKILRLLFGRRGASRRGAPPAVEAALRAKRARDHLARKRRRDGWEGRDPVESRDALDPVDALDALDALATLDARARLDAATAAPSRAGAATEAPLMSSRPISTLPDPALPGEKLEAAPEAGPADAKSAGGRSSSRSGDEPAPFTLEPPRHAGSPRRSAGPVGPAATTGTRSALPGSSRTASTAGSPTSTASSARASSASSSARTASRPRRAAPRASASRAVGPVRQLPRLVVPGCTLLALGLGAALGRPLFERAWLPRVPLTRVAVVGASVREPMTIAQALLEQAGAPLDRMTPESVRAVVLSDPWLASADSFRLPDGTLLVRVTERHAIARYRASVDEPEALVDPAGHRFLGEVGEGGPLPLVDGPIASEASLPTATLEILTELRRHTGLSADLSALILHLPLAGADAAALDDALAAGETGYVLELGEQGPRALLGQTSLKRRVARLASLLEQRDRLLAGARVIDLRYADRAVLRTEPTSG